MFPAVSSFPRDSAQELLVQIGRLSRKAKERKERHMKVRRQNVIRTRDIHWLFS
jgi:hypothetical protein